MAGERTSDGWPLAEPEWDRDAAIADNLAEIKAAGLNSDALNRLADLAGEVVEAIVSGDEEDEERPKKRCPVCKTGKCKSIPSRYTNAVKGPVFCSQRCAAEWGLLAAAECTSVFAWCPTHGWSIHESSDEAECGDCRVARNSFDSEEENSDV